MAPETVTIVLPHRERFGPSGAGAVGMVAHRHAVGASRYQVRVIGPRFAGEHYPGVAFLPVKAPGWVPATPTYRYALAVAARLARLPPGLVEVHNKPDVAMILARLFPRRPVTLFLHNDPRTMRGANSAAKRTRLLHRLAAVVTVSDCVRRWFLEGVDAVRPVDILPNAISAMELPAMQPQALREPLILFAGRVVPDKAPDAFVAACAIALPQLPGWRAEIIGASGFSAATPDSGFIRDLRPAAAAAGVVLHGYRPHAAVLQAMATAAIVVVPSRWAEPFGLSALEAMACGAAVACSGRGGLAEVVGDAAVTIDPDDPAQMAATLVRLACDPALRTELAARGLQRVQSHFTTGIVLAQLDDLRDRVIAGR